MDFRFRIPRLAALGLSAGLLILAFVGPFASGTQAQAEVSGDGDYATYSVPERAELKHPDTGQRGDQPAARLAAAESSSEGSPTKPLSPQRLSQVPPSRTG